MKANIAMSEAAFHALDSEESVALYGELVSRGYKLFIGKREYAEIIGSSVSSIDNFIKNGYGCPNYKKLGNSKNSKVLFSLIDVANYLAGTTIHTA